MAETSSGDKLASIKSSVIVSNVCVVKFLYFLIFFVSTKSLSFITLAPPSTPIANADSPPPTNNGPSLPKDIPLPLCFNLRDVNGYITFKNICFIQSLLSWK